jgi:hypothetical protein
VTSLEERRASRRQADLASVRALIDLLKAIADKPDAYASDSSLCGALKSQGSLARHEDAGRGVLAMSLNHQKALSDQLPGGYESLDRLRRAAISAIEQFRSTEARGNVENKLGMRSRIRTLEAERQLLLQDLFILQRAYDLRCIQARSYAQSADEATRARCAKEQREIDASFSLRTKRVDSGNVRDIGEARKS